MKFAIKSEGKFLLADEMDVGKTIQAIGIVNIFNEWPLLIVCPSSLVFNW